MSSKELLIVRWISCKMYTEKPNKTKVSLSLWAALGNSGERRGKKKKNSPFLRRTKTKTSGRTRLREGTTASFFWSLPRAQDHAYRLEVHQIVIQSSTQSSLKVRICTEQRYRKRKSRYRKWGAYIATGLTVRQFLDGIVLHSVVHTKMPQTVVSRMQKQSLKEKFTHGFHWSFQSASTICVLQFCSQQQQPPNFEVLLRIWIV